MFIVSLKFVYVAYKFKYTVKNQLINSNIDLRVDINKTNIDLRAKINFKT